MKEKKELTPEQVYKKNQKKAKVFSILAPIVFWSFLAFALIFLIFAFRNSFGNMIEISNLLDDEVYTGEQLQENYNMLIEKYGEWTIGKGGSGFTITFVNIKKAVFSGFMILDCFLSVFFYVSAFVLGKWLLPNLSKQIDKDNQDMVNLTVLKNNK